MSAILDPKNKLEKLQELIEKTMLKTSLPHYNPNECFVRGIGPLDACIMIIGEAPGREESEQGKPFVGRSGRLLSILLQNAEINREKIYITNVVKYRPENNKTPTYKECIEWANIFLKKEIEIVAPQVILTLGASATKTLLGENTNITNQEGVAHHYEDKIVIPTFHPAYLLRCREKIAKTQETLFRLKSYEQNC